MTEVDIRLERDRFTLAIKEVFAGGITGIYGPSGSGKTSLLQAVAGLEKPQAGHIGVNGRVLFNSARKICLAPRERRIGYVFQEGRLFPHMTVAQNLKYGLPYQGKPLVAYDEIIDLLGLEGLLHRKPQGISGGEKQRTALGRALLSAPDMLLLDEPFAAVDQGMRRQIIPLILKVQQRVNIPLWVVSHNLEDLLKLTSRLCLIRDGHCIGHNHYVELLRQAEAMTLLGDEPVGNSMQMEVAWPTETGSLIELQWPGKSQQPHLKCQVEGTPPAPGSRVRVVIRASDIALSQNRLDGVSIQNQIPGKVLALLGNGDRPLCLVDTGVPLAVEITGPALRQLGLEPGKAVWCLIKSVAVQVIG
ncbi:molybdenum ABC transporter ATP-binding protein [Robiginitalea sp. M366]|uniref:molybdenum ABC transporter ATP-binding protein n=1 Tax=Robiginitalea aestuariiviva TaxID=3036903 RepID=UPI00240E68DD|nr:molybdenum ABC transporter ATP-binding protein [Robiginitalea aestuariiviva]MDG1572311.1 molybdenum ABC transporter ATP-binding protein [Robiginitalea aestuariiviva]